MADSKLSALAAATGIGSTDELYVNDGGISKKVSNITIADGASVSGSNTGDQDLTASGTGNLVRVSNATLVAPALGTPASGVMTNVTGIPVAALVSGALAEQVLVGLDPAGSADEKWSGISVAGTAGATLATGDLIYLDVTATEWLLADADAAATAGDVPLGLCILAATDGGATDILLIGTMRSAAFPASIALGAPVYVSTTAGDIQATQPSGADDVIRRVGWAISSEPNTLYF